MQTTVERDRMLMMPVLIMKQLTRNHYEKQVVVAIMMKLSLMVMDDLIKKTVNKI